MNRSLKDMRQHDYVGTHLKSLVAPPKSKGKSWIKRLFFR